MELAKTLQKVLDSYIVSFLLGIIIFDINFRNFDYQKLN